MDPLLAAVGFVLLIACANLGHLLLARAGARQREIAIRAAIGAGRDRLLGQFLVEGLVLALCGGALGLGMARVADVLLVRPNPAAIPRLAEVAIDWRVCLFALAISLLCGTVFGLAPALVVSANSLYRALKDGGRSSTGLPGLRLRSVLVAAELAMAMVLLTGAGLMIKSFSRMYAHPAGFVPEQIALLKVFLSGPAYRQRPAVAGYPQRVIERLAQVPGVQGAAVMSSSAGPVPVELEGPQLFVPGQTPQVRLRAASAGYRAVVGIPLVEGRWTTDNEREPVAMVNQAFVRRVLGGGEALGRRVRANGTVSTVVGVTGDLKIARLDADPDPELLIPYQQMAWFGRFDILVRTMGAPGAVLPEVRSVVLSLDPSQPPYGVTTLEQALRDTVAPRRFNLILLATFAASAVMLALAGIYGVIANAVTQRTHEIGVRMALGAGGEAIVRMVVGQGIAVALAGIGVGIAAALGLTRLMTTLLYEVKPDDPATFAAVAALLAMAALAASWIPARKAAHVDPLEALRYE